MADAASNKKLATLWLRKTGALLCLSAVLLASGFHTVALQSYGWARMYDVYSDSLPAADALDLTFSGVELCGICVLSQELSQDLENSIELSLNENIPLLPPQFHSVTFALPEAKPVQDGPSPQRNFQEITLEIEPPPPRCA